MLVLHRKVGQRVRIRTSDGDIWVEVREQVTDRGRRLVLGFEAPDSVTILREEIIEEPDHE